MNPARLEAGSFRDRHGQIYHYQGRILRGVSKTAMSHWQQLQSTGFYNSFSESGRLVKTWIPSDVQPAELDSKAKWHGLLEHEPITIISYPYEWTFGMLRDAAILQLELLQAALEEEMILKDSTPYNIQFEGTRPVFIDIPSLERYQAGSAWVGYRQFCQMYLYPLMFQAYKNLPFQAYLKGSIDGIAPDEAAAIFSFRDRFRAGVFSHAYLQSKLEIRYSAKQKSVSKDLKNAGFNQELIKANIRRLLKLVKKLQWQPPGSEWAEYSEFHNYNESDHARKEKFVAKAARSTGGNLVWDIGCNTGQFSRIAAEHANTVVALDADHLAVDHLYRKLKSTDQNNILPLVMNLSDPSPNWGWRGVERTELATRATPDLVLCLALLHHAVISANIPVRQFVEWLVSLDADIVIEFVGRDDDKVQQLLRNKADQYDDYQPEYFERCLKDYFSIEDRMLLNEGRREIFFCKKFQRAMT